MDMKTWLEKCLDTAIRKGFWANEVEMPVTAKKMEKIALMHSELGEMTEGVRKPGPDEHCPEFSKEEIELADVFIRAGDYAAHYELRLIGAIEAKMAFNDGRPYLHGKKF